jgi:hypothetical protein
MDDAIEATELRPESACDGFAVVEHMLRLIADPKAAAKRMSELRSAIEAVADGEANRRFRVSMSSGRESSSTQWNHKMPCLCEPRSCSDSQCRDQASTRVQPAACGRHVC